MPDNGIRVIIADDHALFRAGLRELLQGLEDVQVVAEAEDGIEALRVIAEHRPHIALMDISMPDLNGLTATARIAKEFPDTRVLILSMHADQEHVRQALRAGAAGYLLKAARRDEFEMALRAIARGEQYLSSKIAGTVMSVFSGRGDDRAPIERLTPRQREILQLLAEGHAAKQIATRLNLSVKTVETHRSHIMARLGIHDLAGLVRFAIRAGLISAEP